jgi:hypothetical protein
MQDAIWAGCTVGRHWRARRVGCRGGGGPGSRRVRIGAAVQTDGEWSRERAETRGDGRREKKKWIMGITNTQKSMVLLGQSQSSPTDESGVESCARRLNPQRLGNCPVVCALLLLSVKHPTLSLSGTCPILIDITLILTADRLSGRRVSCAVCTHFFPRLVRLVLGPISNQRYFPL